MEVLCRVCDRILFENEDERNNYLATLRKENDNSIYDKHTIKNINLDEAEKILNDYVTSHNKKFYFSFIR